MAALTNTQLAKIRRKLADVQAPDYLKPHVNAAASTINDLFDGVKAQWSQQVDTATQAMTPPYTFSNNQKKKIFAGWLVERFIQEDE